MESMKTDAAQDASQRPENWPLGRLLGAASRSIERAWAEALATRGLTHAGLVVLHQLETGQDSQAEIARITRVEAQTMSRTVDRLVREKLVTRTPDPHDRRRHVLHITEAGHNAFNSVRNLEDEVFPVLEDPDTLRKALLDIVTQTRSG